MTTVERTVSFDEEAVTEWCERSNDSNDLHLSETVASDSQFGERIVPGLMVLDQISGLVTQYGQTVDGEVVLANIVAARFRDPISFDEDVTLTLEEDGSDNHFTYLAFEATTDRGIAVHGRLGVVFT